MIPMARNILPLAIVFSLLAMIVWMNFHAM
jgi:hypothetical protein